MLFLKDVDRGQLDIGWIYLDTLPNSDFGKYISIYIIC
jgi:hypothetical protein